MSVNLCVCVCYAFPKLLNLTILTLAMTNSRHSPPIIQTCQPCPAASRQSDFERLIVKLTGVRYERVTDVRAVQLSEVAAHSAVADVGHGNFDAVASQHHRKRNGV